MRDIIMVLSDQHSGLATSLVNPLVNTPNLSLLADTSQVFEYAYANCPLCVPSRMSFLSGEEPNQLGIYNNDIPLNSNVETLAHKLSEQGYRTVLVGRMHFKGEDQYHGFDERYIGDITTQWWGQKRNDLGVFDGTLQMSGCLKEFGYGDSPVQEFDRTVLKKAMELLQVESKQPLFMIVGFYGPHFPYCVKEEYFQNYFKLDLNLKNKEDECHEVYQSMQLDTGNEVLQNVRAAYYGLVEHLDNMIGLIHKTVRKRSLDSIFIYTSDHGDQIGKRSLYGKKTIYEDSIRIPLWIEDRNLKAKVYRNAVSLLELHYTILNYAGIEVNQETVFHKETPVVISSIIENENEEILLQAIRYRNIKLIKLKNEVFLYDIWKDPEEQNNLSSLWLHENEHLQRYLLDEEETLKIYYVEKEKVKTLREWTKINQPKDEVRFKISSNATRTPKRRKLPHEI